MDITTPTAASNLYLNDAGMLNRFCRFQELPWPSAGYVCEMVMSMLTSFACTVSIRENGEEGKRNVMNTPIH